MGLKVRRVRCSEAQGSAPLSRGAAHSFSVFPPPPDCAVAAQVALAHRSITICKDHKKVDKSWVEV
jgi:hypothetical protein